MVHSVRVIMSENNTTIRKTRYFYSRILDKVLHKSQSHHGDDVIVQGKNGTSSLTAGSRRNKPFLPSKRKNTQLFNSKATAKLNVSKLFINQH